MLKPVEWYGGDRPAVFVQTQLPCFVCYSQGGCLRGARPRRGAQRRLGLWIRGQQTEAGTDILSYYIDTTAARRRRAGSRATSRSTPTSPSTPPPPRAWSPSPSSPRPPRSPPLPPSPSLLLLPPHSESTTLYVLLYYVEQTSRLKNKVHEKKMFKSHTI